MSEKLTRHWPILVNVALCVWLAATVSANVGHNTKRLDKMDIKIDKIWFAVKK